MIVCWVLFTLASLVGLVGGVGYLHYQGELDGLSALSGEGGENPFAVLERIHPRTLHPGDGWRWWRHVVAHWVGLTSGDLLSEWDQEGNLWFALRCRTCGTLISRFCDERARKTNCEKSG